MDSSETRMMIFERQKIRCLKCSIIDTVEESADQQNLLKIFSKNRSSLYLSISRESGTKTGIKSPETTRTMSFRVIYFYNFRIFVILIIFDEGQPKHSTVSTPYN